MRAKPKRHKNDKDYPATVCAARDCDVSFIPRVKGQKFHSRKCNDREWQRIYRERQKLELLRVNRETSLDEFQSAGWKKFAESYKTDTKS